MLFISVVSNKYFRQSASWTDTQLYAEMFGKIPTNMRMERVINKIINFNPNDKTEK